MHDEECPWDAEAVARDETLEGLLTITKLVTVFDSFEDEPSALASFNTLLRGNVLRMRGKLRSTRVSDGFREVVLDHLSDVAVCARRRCLAASASM